MCNGLITFQVQSNPNLPINLSVFIRCKSQNLNTPSLFCRISRLTEMNLRPFKTRNSSYSTSHNKLQKMRIANQARLKIRTKRKSLRMIICSKSLREKFIARSFYQKFTERMKQQLDGKLKKTKIQKRPGYWDQRERFVRVNDLKKNRFSNRNPRKL